MNKTTAAVVLAVTCLVSATMLGGCWMVNVAPLADHCAKWNIGEGLGAGQYVLVPCPGGTK